MATKQQCEYIVEKILELTKKGEIITFSEHCGGTVVEWGASRERPITHDHVNEFNGLKGEIQSLAQIIARIEDGNNT